MPGATTRHTTTRKGGRRKEASTPRTNPPRLLIHAALRGLKVRRRVALDGELYGQVLGGGGGHGCRLLV